MKIFRSIAMLVLPLAAAAALFGEAGIFLPAAGHRFVELLIIVALCKLEFEWVRADEIERLRNRKGACPGGYRGYYQENNPGVWYGFTECPVEEAAPGNNGHSLAGPDTGSVGPGPGELNPNTLRQGYPK